MRGLTAAGLGCLALYSTSTLAHSFGRLYTLPVPLWMYTWGASAALILSFVMVGWFSSPHRQARESTAIDLSHRPLAGLLCSRPFILIMQTLSVGGLLLCIATGLFGTGNAYLNFNMTFFWIVFLLGFSYFTALFGGLYEVINPWKLIVRGLSRCLPNRGRGWLTYPVRLSYWPALGLYLLFIWIELFAGAGPRALALSLILYLLLNLLGSSLVGPRDWFRHAEFFAVLFRLISKMAPLQYLAPANENSVGKLTLQAPFSGLLKTQAQSLSELLFVLFILSSTAFDGLQQTEFWARLYWQDIAVWLRPWAGENIVQAYPLLSALHSSFQTGVLLLSPFIYLVVYLACIHVMRRVVRSTLSTRELALRFAYSLLPIALVYHVTHYYTLILTQGSMILRLASDPFGVGWNLFGTAQLLPRPIIPDMDWVWNTQVGLILLGHIASVYLAHREALAVFPERRDAIISQLPMLILMVAFTCFGLWILAQPITATVLQ